MIYSFSELKKKCVINLEDGKKLGKISDIQINMPCGKIENFVLGCGVNFFASEQILINPCEIKTIGEDTILVKFSKHADKNTKIEIEE